VLILVAEEDLYHHLLYQEEYQQQCHLLFEVLLLMEDLIQFVVLEID
jgi:hypothetical protein